MIEELKKIIKKTTNENAKQEVQYKKIIKTVVSTNESIKLSDLSK